jgi:hypothetical protein
MSEVTAIIIHPDQVLHYHGALSHEGLRQLLGGDYAICGVGPAEDLVDALAWIREDGTDLPENRVGSVLLHRAGYDPVDWINGTLVLTGDADADTMLPQPIDAAWVAEFPEEVFG